MALSTTCKKNLQSPGLKILFADDETHLQELMRAELPRMGHQVTVCPDGLTAVAALEMNIYDCVLVDLDMPGLNGIEVIAKVKELSPETETVVLTGKGSIPFRMARGLAWDWRLPIGSFTNMVATSNPSVKVLAKVRVLS